MNLTDYLITTHDLKQFNEGLRGNKFDTLLEEGVIKNDLIYVQRL